MDSPPSKANAPDPHGWLGSLAAHLGADRAIWKPVGGKAHAWPRLAPREVDWGRVAALAPGCVDRVGACPSDFHVASARSVRSSHRFLWVRARAGQLPPGGLGGDLPSDTLGPAALGLAILRSRGEQPFEAWPDQALVEMVGGAAWALAQGPGERLGADPSARRLIDLGGRAAGLLHDVRNQLTLTTLLARQASAMGNDDAWDEVLEQLGTAHGICAGGLLGEPNPARTAAVRPILMREVRAASESARCRLDPPVRPLLRCAGELEWGTRPDALGRLVRNLALNAYEASYPGGALRIWAKVVEEHLHIVVEDEGRGMGPGKLRHLFEAGQSGSGGTGFGTASLRSCLEELDGRIEVHSSPGAGTRIRLVLPKLCEQPILVLDPDPRRRAANCAALENQGHRTKSCGSTARAIELLQRHEPQRLLIARGCPPGPRTASAPTQLAELRRRAFLSSIPVRMTGAPPGGPACAQKASKPAYSGAVSVART